MRLVCSLFVCGLFVFTLIAGRNHELATSPPTPVQSDSDPNGSGLPDIADLAWIDSTDAWVTDRHGTLYHTSDGTSFRKQAMKFGAKTLLSFIDRKTGFAFSHRNLQGEVWRTTDAGETWQKLTEFDQDLPDFQLTSLVQLDFVDRQHGWLIDVFGVWRTQDGGTHWERVFRTSDLKKVVEVTSGSFNGIDRAMVMTSLGIQLTVDGGKVWKQTNRDTGSRAICSINKDTYWVWSDSLIRTGDGGNTWQELYKLKGTVDIFSLHFINQSEGWASGVHVEESFNSVVRNPDSPAWHGTVLHTTDGGKNWTEMPVPKDGAFLKVAFSDPKRGWLVGMDRVYRTVDGGVTWTTVLEVPDNW